MVRIGEQSQKLMRDFLERQKDKPATSYAEANNITAAFVDLTQAMMQNPEQLVTASVNLWQDYMKLWSATALRMMGEQPAPPPVITPAQNDRRFQGTAWNENAVFDYIKQSYLLSSRWLQNTVKETQGLDEKTARKVDFYTRQFVDAISPSNFLMTNPEVLQRTVETGGENLVKGLENLLNDLERGNGELKITMTDEKAFEVGKNLATTPGKVVFQNDLIQLIQYEPLTENVFATPLLIIPPWINKFYILDLGVKKSYVRYLLEQGHSVFMISWVNPDEHLARKSFEDYMGEGPMAAIEQMARITGQRNVNVVGYCLGGTLLACMLAYLNKHPNIKSSLPTVSCATYLVTMLDFSEAGELSIFIDDDQLSAMEERMNAQGYLDASAMATTFNMLRANDLIWSFVVNNYLMGKEPFPFDLLYWNSDSTRMPAAMHSFYLREMYQQNKLVKGKMKLKDTLIDLTQIDTPAFFLSTKDDHISPWKSTYMGALLMKGPVRFTLSASGHIAGVVNPQSGNKYNYWTNARLPKNADMWFGATVKHDGSWWAEWVEWLNHYAGEKIPARHPATDAIEDAPGSYVRVKAS
ncbi:MAG: class I poly(R)-hydroxyalkanoic acid synthase [Alphaproteobacteria bacterium]|nr:class I poly(R)-hydroxyalkanoic acid synthase [Alphaproteobacteria bacterium]